MHDDTKTISHPEATPGIHETASQTQILSPPGLHASRLGKEKGLYGQSSEISSPCVRVGHVGQCVARAVSLDDLVVEPAFVVRDHDEARVW